MKNRTVLVLGATGNQGGAVVTALLKDHHKIIGVARNVESPNAQKLIDQGVEMVSADFTDKASLMELMKKVDTVFAMTTPGWGGDIAAELRQGFNIIDAAKEANVEHLIYNSVSDANTSTGIGHFDSKYEIEKHLKASGLNYTIVAPAYFYENIFFPYVFDAIKADGELRIAMPADTKLQQISVADIGKFVGTVVNQGEKMFGQRINIAGDAISGEEVAKVLTKVLDKKVTYNGFSTDYLKQQSEEMAKMFDWFNEVGYSAKLEDLAPYHLMTFSQWAEKQNWAAYLK